MRVTSLGYPTEIYDSIPAFNDLSKRFSIRITGGEGRNLRLIDAYATPSWAYDNVFVRFNDAWTRGYVHGAASPSTVGLGILSDDDLIAFTGAGSPDVSSFAFFVEIETGPGTGEYTLLTTSQVGGIEIIEVGESYAAATDYGGGAPVVECFWTDITGELRQECEDAPPAGGCVTYSLSELLWFDNNSSEISVPAWPYTALSAPSPGVVTYFDAPAGEAITGMVLRGTVESLAAVDGTLYVGDYYTPAATFFVPAGQTVEFMFDAAVDNQSNNGLYAYLRVESGDGQAMFDITETTICSLPV